MRVFVTGATGFIGMAVVAELLGAGHEVLGMARSAESGKALAAAGAQVHVGNLEDVESLRRGAAACEGVVHLAFYHQIGHMSLGTRLKVILGGAPGGIVLRFARTAMEVDRRAIAVMAGAIRGADRVLVTPIGTLSMTPGRLANEDQPTDPHSVGGLRAESERAVLELGARGVRSSVIRLAPMVHDARKQGLGTMMIDLAKKKGVSPYLGDGTNRWSALHVSDAARLFRLALERGSGVYHGVAEEGVPMRAIAEAIGRRVNVPARGVSAAEAKKHYGFLEMFVKVDNPVSSQLTQQRLDWQPNGPGVIGDLESAG